MKKHIIAVALSLCMLLPLTVPALADGNVRLVGVNLYVDGQLEVEYTYDYDNGALPVSGRMHQLNIQTIEVGGQIFHLSQPDTEWVYIYDDQGRLICSESTIMESGNAHIYRWAYDEDGRLVRDEWEYTADRYEGSGTNYIYDEAGHLVMDTSEDGYGIIQYVDEYDCDEEGCVTSRRLYFVTDWDDVGEPTVWGPEPVSEDQYAYDEDGRIAGMVRLYGGDIMEEIAYAYEDDPYFTVQYCDTHDYLNDTEGSSVSFIIRDAADRDVLTFSLPGAPELTRDEAGYIVKAESENRVMEFIYEE